MINPELLLKIARDRLKFQGNVTLREVPQSEAKSPEFGDQVALTSSNSTASQHLVVFVAGKLTVDGFFHEFCHIKLNEIGYKKVENIIESEHSPELNRSAVFIAEAYANYLLFRYFKEEAALVSEQLDYSFLFVLPLRIIVEKLGFAAIAQAAGYCFAKMRNGINDEEAMRATFEEVFGRNKVTGTFTDLLLIMSKLPPITECDGEIQNMSSENINSIVELVFELCSKEKQWNG